MNFRLARCAVITSLVCVVFTGHLAADDFRVATQVFIGIEDDKSEPAEPIVETITVFSDGVIYDFMTWNSDEKNGTETTLFDPKRKRIVLLDPKRKVKTTLSTDSVLSFSAEIKTRLIESDKSEFANPTFEASTDTQAKRLTLENDRMRYEVHGISPKTETSLEQCLFFADWYARLNAMRPGNSPPFARLRVNSELAELKWFPVQVHRTIFFDQRLKRQEYVLRSKHQVAWVLSHSDRQRIDKAGTAMAAYRAIRFTDYLELKTTAKKPDGLSTQ